MRLLSSIFNGEVELQGSQWVDVMKMKRAIHEEVINKVRQQCYSGDHASKVKLSVMNSSLYVLYIELLLCSFFFWRGGRLYLLLFL